MPIERYCTLKDCPGGDGCVSTYRRPGQTCTYEYVASQYDSAHNWKGDGPPPAHWMAPDGVLVYRCLADFYDD
jgi:hypothetical protein